MNSGIYVPELKTYTPLESYASIDDCISIMNRGIEITFPQQTKNEITEKDFLFINRFGNRLSSQSVRNMIKKGTIEQFLEESEFGSYIFQDDNITYEITTTNNTFYNVSISKIDLGECEYILKDIYEIDEKKI